MPRRGFIAAVVVAAAFAGGCSEDKGAVAVDQQAAEQASPGAQKAPANRAAGAEEAGAVRKARRQNAARSVKERLAPKTRSSRGRRPTADQLRAAIENQGDWRTDDLPPRLRRLRAIAAERQGPWQKPRQLSPEEQRAFDIRTQSPKYQP